MSEHDRYQHLFDRYTGATEGKARIADAVTSFMRGHGLRTVIDVGAGNGTMSHRLAGSGLPVLAVEPNPAFAPALEQLRPTTLGFLACRAQDLPADLGPFDLALLSYVLDSMSAVDAAAVCARLQRLIRAPGALVGVTYAEDSPWRRYSATVEAAAGPCMLGGETQVFGMLSAAGYRPRPIRRLSTTVDAASLDELFTRLAFFYRRAGQRYEGSRDRLLPELERHSRRGPGERRSIRVNEVLFTIES